MSMKNQHYGSRWLVFIGTLLLSFFLMLFMSTASPLYMDNPSPDANIMLTVGKGFLHGLMPYRDLFDNRGPLIYLLYSLVALVSYRSFILVYVLESLLLCLDFFVSYRILRLFMSKRLAAPLSLFILPLMFNEYFFQHGDTPESLAIPCLLLLIYQLLKHQDLRFSWGTIMTQGVFVGLAFWVKYTFLFPWVGIGIVIGLAYLFQRRIRELLKLVGVGLIGFLLVTVPVLILYQLNHSLMVMLKVYFLFNVKYYQHSNFDLTQLIKLPQTDVVAMWVEIMMIVSLASVLLLPRVSWVIKAALSTSLVLETLSIITVKVTATYYYTLIAVFSIFILVSIGLLMQWILPQLVLSNPFLACLLVVIAACGILTTNQNYRYSKLFPHNALYDVDQRSTVPYQTRFARIINRSADRSLLIYHTIDVSLYTTLGTLPQSKYFVQNNLNYQPMKDSQTAQLKSLKNKFVVMISLPADQNTIAARISRQKLTSRTLRKHYHLVDATTVLKYTSSVHQYDLTYYLYERNS